MADASTVGKDVTTPLTQGYGAQDFQPMEYNGLLYSGLLVNTKK
jgi:hypothetical protein